ncbi:1-O-acylceramide synthase precursor, putative [Entamoeba dispar SAW760]|uniref:1-O-acylceramide synthase, putative n=1 Tax=Entamoeba dispar (strain ATCC PRA-260 / SAW760) TaxID=370354 RepID=B0ESH8_ENTDS|nr:1-O-acylceramide synthase precursor, putative [Entamoeba dispar SAW760]EDR22520.1 1-O-acylceramide synthase precursor, putative [Entamoeba dispar SAW760]|eukprot:EDR22520.1 1-O-acylceramide synthase precursor, putative [Entamoeba dispar SAW760]
MFLFFGLFSSFCLAQCQSRTPILLVPGIMSTILHAKLNIPTSVPYEIIPKECLRQSDEFRIWENITFLYKYPQCNLNLLKQQYNEKTEEMQNIDGVKVNVPKFGSVYACNKLDPDAPGKTTQYLKPLIDKLRAEGYQDQIDLFCAGFDWRISSISSFQFITDTINLIKQINTSTHKKVIIVSHSYGGLMTKFLFDRFTGYNNYIKEWIAVSTPWKGAFLSIQALLSGLDWLPIDGQLFANVSRSIESNYQLLPHKNYWEKNDLVTIEDKSYNIDNLEEILNQLTPFGVKLYNKTSIKFNSLPEIPKYCIYSSGFETAEYGKYTDWTFKNSQITYGDGDNTVNYNSLIFCKNLGFEQKHLGKLSHMEIVNSDKFLSYLLPHVCETQNQ